MKPPETTGSTLDRDLRLIDSQQRRLALQYLVRESADSASIDGLVEYIVGNSSAEHPPSREATRVKLHHKHLPKLADHGVIEYDPRRGDVRYRSHDRIETLLERVPDN